MGTFAKAASQHDLDTRGDGRCVAARWIESNLDEEDVAEFVRLVNGHKWRLIVRLSDNNLNQKSLYNHAHGVCPCIDAVETKGCCSCPANREADA